MKEGHRDTGDLIYMYLYTTFEISNVQVHVGIFCRVQRAQILGEHVEFHVCLCQWTVEIVMRYQKHVNGCQVGCEIDQFPEILISTVYSLSQEIYNKTL